MGLLRTERTPIGVDVGTRRVKAAQALLRGERAVSIRTASMELPADQPFGAAQAADLRSMLSRRGFCGSGVAVGAAAQLLKIEALELPTVADGAPVNQLAAIEIGRIARLKTGAFEYGAWNIPSPARGGAATHMIGTALSHGDGDKLVEPFLAADFDVVVVCPAPNALAALAAKIHASDEQSLNIILDVGWAGTRLMVVHGRDLVFHRALQDVGIGAIRAELMSGLALPEDVAEHILLTVGTNGPCADLPRVTVEGVHRIIARTAEAIKGELLLTQNYITHRYQQFNLERLLITGGGAAIPGLGDVLAEATQQPVITLSPRDVLVEKGSPKIAGVDSSPINTAAVAHALYAMEAEA